MILQIGHTQKMSKKRRPVDILIWSSNDTKEQRPRPSLLKTETNFITCTCRLLVLVVNHLPGPGGGWNRDWWVKLTWNCCKCIFSLLQSGTSWNQANSSVSFSIFFSQLTTTAQIKGALTLIIDHFSRPRSRKFSSVQHLKKQANHSNTPGVLTVYSGEMIEELLTCRCLMWDRRGLCANETACGELFWMF